MTAVLLCWGLIACGPEDAPPRQVGSSLPTVSYKYRGDKALNEARRTAAVYCDRYFAMPRAARYVNGFIGESVVVFECVNVGAPSADALRRNQALLLGNRLDD